MFCFGIPQKASLHHTGVLTGYIQIKGQVYLVACFHLKEFKHIHYILWTIDGKNAVSY